ncbi:glycosyltransferase [Thiorhodovibrio litoralis]|uniref:glycosyltransferase n=1 Tax=Thiorhodovibrio litoralis TaxID=2952932 RepID=UPI002B25DAB3|nr:glycosyltransferase [Thiorhodovibrio litoralis]WPL10854.1 N-acetylgalactosamine-N,N'-diacetylbacillosaminyl-diphospho-undecaprenol 4-alpha-N-acetylgalactosaminyltransferase [Thiorhodovibrio litoralis]
MLNPKLKRVCFIINNLQIGGAERLLIETILKWQQRPHWELHLVLGDDRIDFDSISSCRLASLHILPMASTFRRILTLRQYFINHNIDVCVSHLERSNKTAAIAAMLARIPCVAVVHNINIYPPRAPSGVVAAAIYNLLCWRVVAVSDAVAEYLNRIGILSTKIKIINNGVDTEAFYHSYAYSFSLNPVTFLFIGRLVPAKNLSLLLAALGQFDRKCNRWKLIVIGNGVERHSLERQARDLHIVDKVSFIDAIPNPWVLLGDSSVLVFTSVREGMPMVLLEGMSIGLPIICSNVGQFPIVVTSENGIVFESGNLHALVDAMCAFSKLSIEEIRSMSIASRRLAAAYDINVCVDKYCSLAMNALENSR